MSERRRNKSWVLGWGLVVVCGVGCPETARWTEGRASEGEGEDPETARLPAVDPEDGERRPKWRAVGQDEDPGEDPDEDVWDPSRSLRDQAGPAPAPGPRQRHPAEPRPEGAPPHRRPTPEGAVDRFPGIFVFMEEQRLEIDAYICLQRGPALELLACTRRGKTHESLLLFDCDPQQFQVALIMLGLEPNPQVDRFGEVRRLLEGPRLVVEVAWSPEVAPEDDPSAPEPNAEGLIRRRVEELIFDGLTGESMARVGWVFTGSRHIEVPAPPDWNSTHEVFASSYTGNIAAVYHDPDAILDTPLLQGGNDQVFNSIPSRIPEIGTEVTVYIRPWEEGDGPALEDLPAELPGMREQPRQQPAEPTETADPDTPPPVNPFAPRPSDDPQTPEGDDTDEGDPEGNEPE